MKNFHYVALTAALLLAPAFVLAEEAGVSANTEARIKNEKPRPPLAPGQILKNIRENASTTRAEVKDVRREIKGEVKQVREESRLKIEAKRAEVKIKVEAAKEKAKEKFGEAVQRSVGNIVDRLTRHVEKLGEIATRIDSRISELQAKGINMDASIELLTTARADIAAAQDKVAGVGAALSAALASTTPKGEMPKVRAAVKAAEDALRAAKDSLKTTLESIRAANSSQ